MFYEVPTQSTIHSTIHNAFWQKSAFIYKTWFTKISHKVSDNCTRYHLMLNVILVLTNKQEEIIMNKGSSLLS